MRVEFMLLLPGAGGISRRESENLKFILGAEMLPAHGTRVHDEVLPIGS